MTRAPLRPCSTCNLSRIPVIRTSAICAHHITGNARGTLRSQRSERLLVNPVAVIDLRAGQLGDRQHPLVVLQDPAELADVDPELPDAVAPSVLDQHEG